MRVGHPLFFIKGNFMKIPCFLITEKCRKLLIWDLIHRLVGTAILLSIVVYFQLITIEYLITHKFFIFSITFGSPILGHALHCYFEKRKRKI